MFGLFGSKGFDPDKFEKSLKQISNKITYREKRQRNLLKSKKYYSKWVLIYSSGIYMSYLGYAYFMIGFHKLLYIDLMTIFLSPVLIGFCYYAIGRFYDFCIRSNEAKLASLRDLHQEEIDKLKEKTNFQKTNELLSRFSTGEDLEELEFQAREIVAKREEYKRLVLEGVSQEAAKTQLNMPRGSVFDTIINGILGPDEVGGPDDRFALICANCYQHNGLAPKYENPEFVKYICPKCGILNGKDKPEESEDLNEADETGVPQGDDSPKLESLTDSKNVRTLD